MADEVARGLWQGDAQDARELLTAPSGFRTLVLCAEEVQPVQPQDPRVPLERFGMLQVYRCPLRDEPRLGVDERTRALRSARFVARSVLGGDRVLVTCAMGWNRSGLVSGLALRALGARPADAVTLVRKARGPNALGNAVFERFVLTARQEDLRT